jgi:hypothetical protein
MDVSEERTVSVFRVEGHTKKARSKQNACLPACLLGVLFNSEDEDRSSSETSINDYQTSWHHILENSSLYNLLRLKTTKGCYPVQIIIH